MRLYEWQKLGQQEGVVLIVADVLTVALVLQSALDHRDHRRLEPVIFDQRVGDIRHLQRTDCPLSIVQHQQWICHRRCLVARRRIHPQLAPAETDFVAVDVMFGHAPV